MVRLDRVVADERWVALFPEAQVQHISMSTLDHCLLALFLRKKKLIKPTKMRFMFEEMWVRDERCRGVIESVWVLTQVSANGCIADKIKMCQSQLRQWNQRTFGNVNTRLKRLKERLQFFEGQNLLHETACEIQEVKKEINETLIREEVMWNQRSRALWLKIGDRNTKFFLCDSISKA